MYSYWAATATVRWNLVYWETKTPRRHQLGELEHCKWRSLHTHVPRSFSTLDELSEDSDENLFFLSRYNPNHVLHRLLPNLRTPVITFSNAHTISHYLQTSALSSNRTLSIECCSEISINLVFRSQCYFASILYSTVHSNCLFYIVNFYFLSYISFYVACAFVICLIKYLLTYLLLFYSLQ